MDTQIVNVEFHMVQICVQHLIICATIDNKKAYSLLYLALNWLNVCIHAGGQLRTKKMMANNQGCMVMHIQPLHTHIQIFIYTYTNAVYPYIHTLHAPIHHIYTHMCTPIHTQHTHTYICVYINMCICI